MRLLEINADGNLSLASFSNPDIPSYAILSHTWEKDDEFTYQDLMDNARLDKSGYQKILFCGEQARKHGLRYFWVDSCCIDQSSSAELTEAINSMFRWYHNAARCYVYLSDVGGGEHDQAAQSSWDDALKRSRWFTRGWTLQELLAPRSVEFFSRDRALIGNKSSLERQIHGITGIPLDALRGNLDQFDTAERLSWASNRQTTREEDQAYCLLGLFNVFLPVIYGEGKDHALKRLRDVIDRPPSVQWDNKELECMHLLRNAAFDYKRFKDRNPRRLPGTYAWVIQHPRFQSWRDSSSSGLVWISADPGCGKSTLSKSLVDEDLKQTHTRTTCYFFFKDDDIAQRNVNTALAAVLHQLFTRKPKLIKYAMLDFATNGDKLSQSFQTLWDILLSTVADPEAGEIFCILDALDECEAAGRYELINAVNVFHREASVAMQTSKLKICLTSRPYPDIERRFNDLTFTFPTIRVHGEQGPESDEISREIDLVIRWRVSQLASELRLTPSEQSDLETQLMGMSHRTYLWSTLVFDSLRAMNRPTERKLKAALSILPYTVNDAYEGILARVDEFDRPQAVKLLHIIVAATRPLTLKEMNVALSIEDHHRSYDDLAQDLDDEQRFEESVRHICGLFVTVVDQHVYLIHKTAHDFLVAKSEIISTGWKYSLSPTESETLLATICLTYLSFTEFDSPVSRTYPTGKYAFLLYAASSWAIHFRKVQTTAPKLTLQLATKVYEVQSQRFTTWYKVYCSTSERERHPPRLASSLIFASYFGHHTIVTELLAAGTKVEERDANFGQTALLWASNVGHIEIVGFLLAANADRGARDDQFGKTSLMWAAQRGHVEVVKLLLAAKADADERDNTYGQTALMLAAQKGYIEVVRVLLAAKADANERDKTYGQTALMLAAQKGYIEVVRVLLAADAVVEAKDNHGQTALFWAAEEGHTEATKVLLAAKADVRAKDNDRQSPLIRAAQHGRIEAVRLLLAANADVDVKDRYGYTAFIWAQIKGHMKVAKLLSSVSY